METTADPRKLFVQVDATNLEGDETYTLNISEQSKASIVDEGEVIPRSNIEVEERTVDFVEFENDSHDKELALEALRESAKAHLAGAPIGTEFSYDTLFIDRDMKEAYLVDTSRFGYHVVREFDGNNVVVGGYVGCYDNAALRIR